ncbi:MAG: hypothetical protein ABJD11_12165 [Gemmatimonadota bacterium]
MSGKRHFSIPILRLPEGAPDLEALRAWREALAEALRPVVPHELFAVWIFDLAGNPILVGPAELSQDNLAVPTASPFADGRQVQLLQEIVADAGYGSVRCSAIRYGSADVGLVLLAALERDLYGEAQLDAIHDLTEGMGPVLGRASRRLSGSEATESQEEKDAESPPTQSENSDASELLQALGQALTGASTPRDFALALSFALQPTLPHDDLGLFIPDATGEQFYRLEGHGFGPLWADPSLVMSSRVMDLGRLFAPSPFLLIRDALETSDLRLRLDTKFRGPEDRARSILGVRLQVLERTVGYLLLGSPGPDFYQDDDLSALDRAGALIAPRIEGFVFEWQYQVLKSHLSVLRHVPMHLSRIAESLAALPLLAVGTVKFRDEAAALLPLKEIEFAIRLGDDARVAIIKPGETTPLADLPQVPIEGTGVANVLRGVVPYFLSEGRGREDQPSILVVPLRSGGQILGAMAMTGAATAPLSRTDLAVGQQLADLIAPHFEILRRTAVPPPFIPGWKRSSRF